MRNFAAAALVACLASMKADAFATIGKNRPAALILHHPLAFSRHSHAHNPSCTYNYKYNCNYSRLFSTTNENENDTTPPLPDTSDPYIILNLIPTADKREIKKAYKRMALKYHPDVRTNSKSTEAQKRSANDDFARINAAYAFLTGKSADRPDRTESEKKRGASGAGAGRAGTGAGAPGSGYGYKPPHRRTAADRKSYSTDWQDYMPKYDESEYDSGGDSFGSIFSDLFSEIGSSAAASGSGSKGSKSGLLNDFISFLEGNFPSAGTKEQKEEDIILDSLLRDGSKQEVKEEFDDAKLLVKQLERKEFDLESQLRAVVVEKESMDSSGKSKTYMEDMRLEEKMRELEARKEVVADYLDRARMRQLKLRKRLEEIRMDSASADDGYGSRRSSSASGGSSGSSGSSSSGSTSGSTSSTRTNASSSSSNAGSSQDKTNDEDAWKKESFGSSRRRGSGRSRSQSSQRASSSADSSTSGSGPASQPSSGSSYSSGSQAQGSKSNSYGGRSSTYASASSSSPSPPPSSAGSYGQTNDQTNIPPHRRLTSRYAQVQEDKRRLREIKVDEEIDKMKKELGL